jgi:hypothetical protein
MELDDDVLFLLGDVAPLYVGPQVVDPPQPAALATPQKPCAEKQRELENYFRGDDCCSYDLANFCSSSK